MSIAIRVAALSLTLALAQQDALREYVDPAGRFQFTYPAEFGTPTPGTNDGFGDRVAAIRFEAFSAGVGGEAALTKGRPVVDLQAAGGLHDAITLEIFPEPVLRLVLQAVPPLTAATFCEAIARERHADIAAAGFATLRQEDRAAIEGADRLRNVAPRVVRCTLEGSTVTFHKEVSVQPGGARQHVYGAVRFLDPPYSTFQVVRADSAPPRATLLEQMAALVGSWRPLQAR
jgi:hypothetical protein